MRESMTTATTVVTWSIFGIFVLDALLITLAIIITAVYIHTRRNQPRLASFFHNNKTFTIQHSILIAICTTVVLGLRSLRLILNVYIGHLPLGRTLYCRITAWTWDTFIALLVFSYVARCWNMKSKYSAASKSVKHWNVKLKERWKQYRLFFKARTHTISTFLTPRSSDSFFRHSTQSLKRAFKRRTSGQQKKKKQQKDDVKNSGENSDHTTTVDPTTRPRGGSVNAIKRRSSSMLEMSRRDKSEVDIFGISPQPPQSFLSVELEDIQQPVDGPVTVGSPAENTVAEMPVINIPSPDVVGNESNQDDHISLQPMKKVDKLKRLSLSDIDLKFLTPLGEGGSSLSRSSDHILLDRNVNPSTILVDTPPSPQTESPQPEISISSSPNNHMLLIPKLNISEVAEKVEDDRRNTVVLKSILTRRKMERENEDGSLTARKRNEEELARQDSARLSARRSIRRLSLKDLKRISATKTENSTVIEIPKDDDSTDSETDTDDQSIREEQVDLDIDSMQVEANLNTHTATNFSFKLNLDSIKKNEDDFTQTDLHSLFGEEFDEDDLYSEMEIEDDGLGSSSGIALGLQRTMVELLNIDATPVQHTHTRISRRLSAASVRRNFQIAELQASILGGNATPEASSPEEQKTLADLMNEEQWCCSKINLSFETKLGIFVFVATAMFAIIEIVFTGAIPYYYPAGAECLKNVYTTVFTYTDPMFYIYFAAVALCALVFIALAVLVASLKVYDFLVYEVRVIAIGSIFVPLAVILTPIMYAAGVHKDFSPVQHYFLNFIIIFWMLLFQTCSIFIPAVHLIRTVNTRSAVLPSMKKMPMAQVDVNAESKDVQDTYPFDHVLTDKQLRDAFRKFLVKMLCPENMFFLDEVALYQQVDSSSKRRELAADILQRFIRSGSLYELNVSNYEKLSMIEKYQRLNQDCPKNLFKELESTIRFTLATDCYKKFLTSAEFRAAVADRASAAR